MGTIGSNEGIVAIAIDIFLSMAIPAPVGIWVAIPPLIAAEEDAFSFTAVTLSYIS